MADTILDLAKTIEDRKKNPRPDSYTCKLLVDEELIYEKLAEELSEIVEAAKKNELGLNGEKNGLVWESADFLYHLMVLLASKDVDVKLVLKELDRRKK